MFSGDGSCFNAFSRVDVRVDVKIPGGVDAYVIDLRGERCVMLNRFLHIAVDRLRTGWSRPQPYGKKPTYLPC